MKKQKNEQTTDDLIRDQMIIQLGLAGLTQHQIREIVGVDIHRVNRIVKHFKNRKKELWLRHLKTPFLRSSIQRSNFSKTSLSLNSPLWNLVTTR